MMGFGGFHAEGMEDWTLGAIKEMNDFINEAISMVLHHTMVFLSNPEHDCKEASHTESQGRTLSDAELRTFFALEDSMTHFLKFARDALEENGQLSVDDEAH